MMKFLLVIAMSVLIGCSFTSAAAIDSGDNEVPESMEGFKETLQGLVRDVAEQIKETADDDMDIEAFIRENKVDDEVTSIVTEEEEELSAVEDDQSTENVESGIRCSWRGMDGRCCQSVRIVKFRLSICITATIVPPAGMRLSLILNGHTIWRRSVVSRHNYHVCMKKGKLKLCISIYNIYVSAHSAKACLRLSGKFLFVRFHKNLGCFYKRFAADEIMTVKETPLQSIEKQKMENNFVDFFLNMKDKKQSGNVLKFQQ